MSEPLDTIFNKILKGEMPCHKVYEDDDFLVILDVFPAHIGHCLVIPKIPAKDIYELDEGLAAKLFPLVQKIARIVKETTGCDGINVLQNNGIAAEQTVFYFHTHIIPRFDSDGIVMKRPTNKFTKEHFEEMAGKLSSRL
ncbi:MAG: HIT family protein [Defluviitaleaceae bacterium]|nr:HIT family protein [Defluviitaleaceae bacterium]